LVDPSTFPRFKLPSGRAQDPMQLRYQWIVECWRGIQESSCFHKYACKVHAWLFGWLSTTFSYGSQHLAQQKTREPNMITQLVIDDLRAKQGNWTHLFIIANEFNQSRLMWGADLVEFRLTITDWLTIIFLVFWTCSDESMHAFPSQFATHLTNGRCSDRQSTEHNHLQFDGAKQNENQSVWFLSMRTTLLLF
jgi:hypothetical protein